MFKLVDFRREHLLPVLDEKINAGIKDLIDIDAIEKLPSKTILLNDTVMLCGGISPYWEGRGQIWAIFSELSKHHFVGTYRLINKWLQDELQNNFRRIELSVNFGSKTLVRRAELLGFTMECERARKYLPNGEDVMLYSMVRK